MTTSSLNTKKLAPIKRPEKRPSQRPRDSASGSVFDRLYNTSTASSKARKEVSPADNHNVTAGDKSAGSKRTGAPRKNATRRSKPVTKTGGAVFSRLYEKGTASSVSKRSSQETTPGPVSRPPMKPKNHL
jgi:ribosomal protein L4